MTPGAEKHDEYFPVLLAYLFDMAKMTMGGRGDSIILIGFSPGLR